MNLLPPFALMKDKIMALVMRLPSFASTKSKTGCQKLRGLSWYGLYKAQGQDEQTHVSYQIGPIACGQQLLGRCRASGCARVVKGQSCTGQHWRQGSKPVEVLCWVRVRGAGITGLKQHSREILARCLGLADSNTV